MNEIKWNTLKYVWFHCLNVSERQDVCLIFYNIKPQAIKVTLVWVLTNGWMFGTTVCYSLILSVQISISTMLFFWTFYS